MSADNKVSYTLMLSRATSEAKIGRMTGSRLLQSCVFAIAVRNQDALRDLLKHIDHIDIPVRGKNLLMTAAEVGNLDAVHVLVDEFKANPDFADITGRTSADIAHEFGHEDIMLYLMDRMNPEHAMEPSAAPARRPGF